MSAPTPAPSRRHEGGATARGLLLTVMGELLLPTGGSAWTATLIDVLGRCGTEEKAVRQALMRTADAGWLRSSRHGRRTRWHLTDAATQMLTSGAARIYGFAGASDSWDGHWLLVLARVPERDRSARHLLRSRLSWAGLGSLAPGVWISPHPARLEEVREVLDQAGVLDSAQVFRAEHMLIGDPAAIVAQAWDLDSIEAGYEAFRRAFTDGRAPKDPLARLVELVHAWRRFPLIDPALPRELLPERWTGVLAADLFARCHEQWREQALRQWEALEAASGPTRSAGESHLEG